MPFRDVIGHRRITSLLARSIAHDSLPPSLIFAGPAGIGKRLTAIAVAQTLNCLAPLHPAPLHPAPLHLVIDACGTCASCTRIARGVHPDVLVVEPGDTGSIKIEQVRDIVDRAAYRPFEGRRRAVIVDDADALAAPAQNAMLKTLEEPPSQSVFILVTARPDALLPTVLSRCPRLNFRPLAPAEIAEALIAGGRTDAEARAVAAAADGSLGQAIATSAGDVVQARDVAQQLLVNAAATPDPRRRIESAKNLLPPKGGATSDRAHVVANLRAMASLLRDAALLSAGGDADRLSNPDVRPVLDRLAKAYEGDRGVRAFAAVDRALLAVERNVNTKIVADWLVLAL
jgi:DNA polymerase III subunit delta'